MKGKLVWIKEKEGNKPGSAKIEGDERFFTVWSFKDYQKGDLIEFDIAEHDYNGKTQYTLNIHDKIPDKDVNADMKETQKPLIATPMTNLRLEAMKLTVQLICSGHVKKEDRENEMFMILGEIEGSPLTEKEAF